MNGVPHIKTYRVSEIRYAMANARRELGEDAILIQTKRLDEVVDGIRYEVTLGVIGGAAAPVATPAPALDKPPAPAAPVADLAWAQEIGRLREDIAALQTILARQFWEPGQQQSAGRKSLTLRNQLVQHGVDADLASEWALALEDSLAAESGPYDEITAAMLEAHICPRVCVEGTISENRALMLLGPAASGKTTAMLKMALEFGIKRGRSVEIWSLDSRATGVDHSTGEFARLLNIPCRTLQSPLALKSALAKADLNGSLILIDTKNVGTGDLDQDHELSNLMSSELPLDSHLVLPATWHPTALRRVVDRYEVFQPSRLFFTMLDQACAFGAMLQEPWRTRKPLSFFSQGPLGSGQIHIADVPFVLERIGQSIAG